MSIDATTEEVARALFARNPSAVKTGNSEGSNRSWFSSPDGLFRRAVRRLKGGKGKEGGVFSEAPEDFQQSIHFVMVPNA